MSNRRMFIKQMMAGGILLPSAPRLLSGKNSSEMVVNGEPAGSDEIRIALIGKGGMGTADANCALRVPGVKITAVCDVYETRLEVAKKQWGDHLFTTKDYNDILKRSDVDAVLIGTPDHWHQPIAIAAMKAGKHVYCEKPVIHKISEAENLINAQRVSGHVFPGRKSGNGFFREQESPTVVAVRYYWAKSIL